MTEKEPWEKVQYFVVFLHDGSLRSWSQAGLCAYFLFETVSPLGLRQSGLSLPGVVANLRVTAPTVNLRLLTLASAQTMDGAILLQEPAAVTDISFPQRFDVKNNVDPSLEPLLSTNLPLDGASEWLSDILRAPFLVKLEHEGFLYTTSTPHHLSALHALSNPDARRYLLEHHDECTPVRSLSVLVRGTEISGPWYGDAGRGFGVRYTLTDWRKRRVSRELINEGILAVHRYFLTDYDLKEVLDEGRVVSSESGRRYPELRSML
ncbi:hypothetical protein C8F01DRAFT_1078390 [Mycena amicta]|nr:hypothetical protein C8F01DRAFT_1078390 [Mycena amicta]